MPGRGYRGDSETALGDLKGTQCGTEGEKGQLLPMGGICNGSENS